jgi:hypothetical protein
MKPHQTMMIKSVSGKYSKALTGVAVLALAFFAGSDGAAVADGSDLPAEARLAQSTQRIVAGGTEEAGGTDRRKTAGAVDQGLTGPSRPLTTRQKRIFVLGLGASEKI